MLHKRCDIKDLLDSKITEERRARDNSTDDDQALTADAKVAVLQEVRVGIFDEPLPD